jgi:hypothetical protein
MERKQALLGILVFLMVAVLCLGGPGVGTPLAADVGGDELGQLPVGERENPTGRSGPGLPGPLDADPDWFGTNGYDRMQIVPVESPAPRATRFVLGPYGGLLDWLFSQIVRNSVVIVR